MRTIKRAMHFIFSAVLIGYSSFAALPEAAGQEAGWITVFDGKDLDGWDQLGGSNWRVADRGADRVTARGGRYQIPQG